MNLFRLPRPPVVYWIAGCCILLFLLASTVAMLVYHGGTFIDPAAPDYLFTNNFFSDLGRETTYAGQPNTLAHALFLLAIGAVGTGLVLFASAMPVTLGHPRSALWAKAGALFTLVSAGAYVGVALTPWDLYFAWHLLLVKTAFVAFLPTVLFFGIAILRNPSFPRVYAWVMLLVGVILIGYLWLLFFGPSPKSPQGLMIQAAGQKIIVYVQTLGIGTLVIGGWRWHRRLVEFRD